jgi:hypothetical protein
MGYLDKALEAIQKQGCEVVSFDLIESTLKEINQSYRPGLVEWVKVNRSEAWAEIQQTEEVVNNSTHSGDNFGLRQALNRYRELWCQMIRGCEADKRKPGPQGTHFALPLEPPVM